MQAVFVAMSTESVDLPPRWWMFTPACRSAASTRSRPWIKACGTT